MNLLHIIGSMDPQFGGPCQVVRTSVLELEKLGVYNEVISLDDPAASFIGRDLFKTYALGPRKGPWYYSARLIPWLLDNLKRFDAIIIHGVWLYHSYAINKAIRIFRSIKTSMQKNVKIFIMPHGMLDPYFQQAPDRKLKALRNWIYWKLIEQKTVNNADGLLFTCEQELQLARQPFRPYQPKSEINVGFGISAPPPYTFAMQRAFTKMCPKLKGDSYLLFLGRVHEKKGVDILIDAYACLLKKLSKKKSRMPKLVIAGPGLDTPYGNRIKKMSETSDNLSDSICFTGMLSGDAKWGAFYGCEAFVLPSHQENFGISIVEAMACVKPVLISNQVNIWREIKFSDGGLVADDTLAGTEKMLDEWFDLSAIEKQKMGERARASYEKYFAIDSTAKILLNAINGNKTLVK